MQLDSNYHPTTLEQRLLGELADRDVKIAGLGSRVKKLEAELDQLRRIVREIQYKGDCA